MDKISISEANITLSVKPIQKIWTKFGHPNSLPFWEVVI